MSSMKALLILTIFISSCASIDRIGYWVEEKPLKGTREATKFNTHPYWQCVSNRMWTHNTECD